MKRSKKSLKTIFAIIICIIALCIYINENLKTEEIVQTFSDEEITDEYLKIYFFDVGQADCILAINNGETVLIDAGNNEDGRLLTEYIKLLGITRIDYLIGTHAHEDHIGGMDNIINEFEIGNIYIPYTSEESNITKTYEEVLDSIIAKNLKLTKLNINDKFSFGNVECEVLYVDNNEPEDLNDSSICIRMVFNKQSYLFMGDASKKVEGSKNWPETTVLKVGHHGSKYGTSEDFLKEVKPEISIISVGNENMYGHPNLKTLDRLQKINSKIYRTDINGTICLISDGITNKVKLLQTSLNGG